MTMKDKPKKNLVDCFKISTVHVMVGLLLLSTFLTAGMFTFHLGVWDLQKQQITKIEQQADDLANILSAIDRGTKQQIIDSKERFEQSQEQREQQLNLSKITIPLILDVNEDLEQVKAALNISHDDPEDKIKIELDNTYMTINNDTRIRIADFLPPPSGAPFSINSTINLVPNG